MATMAARWEWRGAGRDIGRALTPILTLSPLPAGGDVAQVFDARSLPLPMLTRPALVDHVPERYAVLEVATNSVN